MPTTITRSTEAAPKATYQQALDVLDHAVGVHVARSLAHAEHPSAAIKGALTETRRDLLSHIQRAKHSLSHRKRPIPTDELRAATARLDKYKNALNTLTKSDTINQRVQKLKTSKLVAPLIDTLEPNGGKDAKADVTDWCDKAKYHPVSSRKNGPSVRAVTAIFEKSYPIKKLELHP